MYQPVIRINELKNALIRFRVVETTLDAVIIFLSLLIVLSYAGISSIWALILPPLLFFFIVLKYRADVNIIKLIEKRYPSLRERLGALYDSRNEKNIVFVNSNLNVCRIICADMGFTNIRRYIFIELCFNCECKHLLDRR